MPKIKSMRIDTGTASTFLTYSSIYVAQDDSVKLRNVLICKEAEVLLMLALSGKSSKHTQKASLRYREVHSTLH